MAELFLSPVLRIVIQKATDLVIGEFRTARDAEKDCQKLCRILPAVQVVVDDAEKRSGAEPAVKGWVSSLRAAAVEAEDVLDELRYDAIAKTAEAEIQLEKRKVPHCLPRCSLFKNNIFKSYSDGKRLKGILENIETNIAEMDQFGFVKNQRVQPFTTIVNRPGHHSNVVQSKVIGRDDDLENIVAIVLSQAERKNVAVLPIVGMGGLGKTTLAQLIYNSERIDKHFNLRLWVCVSDEFHVGKLAKKIIDLAIQIDSKVPLDNLQLLSQRLRAELGGKRFFLVLDDVWNEISDEWEDLRLLLDCGSPGSAIIVTTRSNQVGYIVHTMDEYNLKELNEEHLWGIFKQKAFGRDVDERPELVEIGKQLMKKCCGSPLVATMLGGLQSDKSSESEWLDVLESDNLIEHSGIMSWLKLSYESLSSHTKQCFIFCVVYPKDFLMEKDTLIQLWMANSYIPSEGGMELEAKGKNIFDELAQRGFFQDVKENHWGVVGCRMHDLIHDLAQSLVGTTCVSLPSLVQQSDILSKETFHVSSSNKEDICNLFEECSSIHTILSLYEYSEENCMRAIDLSKAKLCRALGYINIRTEEILVKPRTLKHLRYLDLSNSSLVALPESLCTFYNLQTLKLTKCRSLVRLPEGMRQMRSLRHVYLDECDSLERMPACLGKLSCLQTLTRYIVDPVIGCGIVQLKELNLGGLLKLYDLHKVGNQHEAKLANLISKKRLRHLSLYWGSSVDHDSARDVLEGLEPCRTLQSLVIYNYNGAQFAAWMHNPTKLRNITKLTLSKCQQSKVLGPIWQLPLLNYLELKYLESLKHICSGIANLAQRQGDGDSQDLHMFPKLEELILHGLTGLEKWQENDPADRTSLALPQLRQLYILYSPKLDVLPSCPLVENLNLQNLDSLKYICCTGSAMLDQGDGKALPMFPKLQILWLANMKNLGRWEESDAAKSTSLALPQLRKLWIYTCPKLDVLPSCPSLSCLSLSGVGLKHICSSPGSLLVPIFPVLQEMHLKNMLSLERWQENDPVEQTSLAFPQLDTLWITECPKLDALPSCPLLTELKISGTSNIPSSVIESFKNRGVEVITD